MHDDKQPLSGTSIPPADVDILEYIALMAIDLRTLALSAHMPRLAYLLDMARLEAEQSARGEERASPLRDSIDDGETPDAMP